MQIQSQTQEKYYVTLTVDLSPEEVESGLARAYKKVVRQINVPGFRKGKFPRPMLEARYGVEVLYDDALDALLPEVYDFVLKETKWEPIDRPEVDVVTFEFENIPLSCAEFVASRVELFPKAEALKITQHRILEKNFLNSIGVRTAEYAAITSLEDLQNNLAKFGKAILKTATMGYDGKGQFVLQNASDAENAWPQVSVQELILEKFCPFDVS